MAPFRSTGGTLHNIPPPEILTTLLAFAPRAKTLADMEPTASRNSAARASSAIVEQGDISFAHAQSLLSPPSFFPQPHPDLISMSDSRSRPPAMGGGSVSVLWQATSQSLPSSSFPAPGVVHTSGDHMFTDLEAPVGTPFRASLNDHLWQGQGHPSSWTALNLPMCPSQGAFSGFAGQSMVLEQSHMSLFSLTSGSGLPPRSSIDKCFGFTQLSSSKETVPQPPPFIRVAGASSSHKHATSVIFTNAEKKIIRKDKKLQELVKTEPKRAKRNVSNRISAAKRRAIKDIHTLELERKIEMMKKKCNTKSAELELLQERCAELETQHVEMSIMMQELERQAMLKDAVNERLQAQIQALNHINQNSVQMSSHRIDETIVVQGSHSYKSNYQRAPASSGTTNTEQI